MAGQNVRMMQRIVIDGIPVQREITSWESTPPREKTGELGGSFIAGDIRTGVEKMAAKIVAKGLTPWVLKMVGRKAGSPVTVIVSESWEDEDGENYDVNIRLSEQDRSRPSDLQQLYFSGNSNSSQNGATQNTLANSTQNSTLSNNSASLLIPFSAVATMEETLGASQINRRDLTREILVEANTAGRPAGDIGRDIENLQKTFDLPAGYSFSTQGANADMAESAGYAMTAITFIRCIF